MVNRAGARVLLACLVISVAVTAAGRDPEAAHAAAGDLTESTVTVRGTGAFADLEVTVSQTKNLINQVVLVTWTGGKQTQPPSARYGTDFLQLMQCWSSPSATGGWEQPTREQCQFGATPFRNDTGFAVGTRQLEYPGIDDQAETYRHPPAGTDVENFVPFRSVTGKEIKGRNSNEFFDGNTTNEVSVTRTRVDGTGEQTFEVQTATQAPGIGCGERLTDGGGAVTGRPCWLVIVPEERSRGRRQPPQSLRSVVVLGTVCDQLGQPHRRPARVRADRYQLPNRNRGASRQRA